MSFCFIYIKIAAILFTPNSSRMERDNNNLDIAIGNNGSSEAAIPFQFLANFTGVMAGPTGCGKTWFAVLFIIHILLLMNPIPQEIVYYYSIYQPVFDFLAREHGVKFRKGCPEIADFDGKKRTLVFIDDLMDECGKAVLDLFTKGSHHLNLSVWFMVQNFFHKSKEMRTITLNAQYILLFKNPRDRRQIKVLAGQLCDTDAKALLSAYEEATSKPYGYLLIDLKQETPDILRYRSGVFPGQKLKLYISKKAYKGDQLVVTISIRGGRVLRVGESNETDTRETYQNVERSEASATKRTLFDPVGVFKKPRTMSSAVENSI